MLSKNMLTIFSFFAFIKTFAADLIETQPNISERIRTELQYALMHHNEIIKYSELDELFIGERLCDIIMEKAIIELEQKAKIVGWDDAISEVKDEFSKSDITSSDIWVLDISGYINKTAAYTSQIGDDIIIIRKNVMLSDIKYCITHFLYALKNLGEFLDSLKTTTYFKERNLEVIREIIKCKVKEISKKNINSKNSVSQYKKMQYQIIVENQDYVKPLLIRALNEPTHDILVEGIRNNYPAIVKLILKQGIVPTRDDLMLAKELYDSESEVSYEAKESFGRIIKIIYNCLKLLTPIGGISKQGIIYAREEITPEITHHIAQFLD